MISAGQIYYCENYEFGEGGCSNKLFIILNTPPNPTIPIITCLTTTNFWYKPQDLGCYSDYGFFIIEKDYDWFNQKTWFELHRTDEFNNKLFIEKVESGFYQLKNRLRKDTINAIINCALHCDDISEYKAHIITACKDCDKGLK